MSNYGDLLYELPNELKNLFRNLERTSRKIIMSNWSLKFNKTCLKENLLPKYSNFRNHDPAVARSRTTLEYRKYLVKREIEVHENKLCHAKEEKEYLDKKIDEFQFNLEAKNNVKLNLDQMLMNFDNSENAKIVKKLNNLYNGHLVLKEEKKSFLNLSNYQLSPVEEDFLNLGLNLHIQSKYSKLHKHVQMELLYQNLVKLEKEQKLVMNPRLKELMSAEATKHRNTKHHSMITPELKAAAKKLKNNEDLVIRKADKTSIYVLLNKNDYLTKIDNILDDTTKFKKIGRDPTSELKVKANKLIDALNAAQGDIKIPRIIGDYKPGYLYGNVKTHKNNYPLRPIISQVLTPTYQLAKTLNSIITPYVPSRFSLKSTNEFIDLIHSNQAPGMLASLDVVSLFTNVPIDATIEIIIKHVYNNSEKTPPKIPKEILRQMLQLCTKEAPFKAPNGKLYLQIDGVTMGSPLGPTFSNFYMGDLEERTFNGILQKPAIYARYIDDVIVLINNQQDIIDLQNCFQNNSVLQFTYELNVDNKLPFLDVLIDNNTGSIKTTVYRKPTDEGHCLNANSECVQRYKDSVIFSYINRAFKITQSWHDFHLELNRIKQLLINNNYSNRNVDLQIRKFLDKKMQPEVEQNKPKTINVYYENQMHENYKIEERTIKKIINENVTCKTLQDKLNLIFYYKNLKSHNLVMRNNPDPPPKTLQQTNVVYEYSCRICEDQHGKAAQYVGMTQTSLSRRLTLHLSSGAIKDHCMQNHQTVIDRKSLEDNTIVIEKANYRNTLAIKEAIIIQTNNPTINRQFNKFDNILKLHHSRPYISSNTPAPQAIHQADEDSATPSQPIIEELDPQTVLNRNNQPNNLNMTLPDINDIDNITISQNASPNINARIQNLLQDARQSHASTPRSTRSSRRLRPRSRDV